MRALELAKASFYYSALLSDKDAVVAAQIRALHATYDDTLGHKKLALLLGMNKKKVLRIMKAHNIKTRRRKKKYTYAGKSDVTHDNLVRDLIKADKVGAEEGGAASILFSDIFEFKLRDQSKVRGCFVLNYRDRSVMSLVFDYGMRAELVTAAIDKADFIKHAQHQHIFHSDQGSQYGAAITLQAIRNGKLTPSMSRAGTPTDNPYAERFVGTFKHSVVRRQPYDSIGEFLHAAEHWIKFYNERRPHEALNNLSPTQYAKAHGLPAVHQPYVGMV